MQMNRVDLQMWLRWVVASTAGLVVGLLMALGITNAGNEDYKILTATLGGVVLGLCLASVQALSVNQYMRMERWILANAIGYGLGFALIYLVNELLQISAWVEEQDRNVLYFGLYSGVVGVVVGPPVGIMQWWNFRTGSVSLIGWVLACMLAIGASIFTSTLVAWVVNTDRFVSGLEIPAILLPPVVIFSIVSGLPMIRTMKTNRTRSELT